MIVYTQVEYGMSSESYNFTGALVHMDKEGYVVPCGVLLSLFIRLTRVITFGFPRVGFCSYGYGYEARQEMWDAIADGRVRKPVKGRLRHRVSTSVVFYLLFVFVVLVNLYPPQ